MMDHESLLQAGLIAWLKADAALAALVGGRVWDRAPEDAAWPHLLIGEGSSRPVAADGGAVEHRLTLICVSRFAGSEEARAVVAAARARLHEAAPTVTGLRIVSLRSTGAEMRRPGEGARTYGRLSLRVVTEEI
ncbi:hypothetical protein ASG17_13815 [Brevundimonas sp. Leaf363]|uniref:DUF3168 domain-containing protein n=1 Tax=Brevundimonas sp. Leaf363 TaxID=1736353 RepID=UPI0006FA94B7|nr:DUF3168 domain-containing protein [Brevundimonas sp. Leaf363]KQS54021.1 hypothetical protein ASG17_13815 [Brevundimonas sp. Leaf363]